MSDLRPLPPESAPTWVDELREELRRLWPAAGIAATWEPPSAPALRWDGSVPAPDPAVVVITWTDGPSGVRMSTAAEQTSLVPDQHIDGRWAHPVTIRPSRTLSPGAVFAALTILDRAGVMLDWQGAPALLRRRLDADQIPAELSAAWATLIDPDWRRRNWQELYRTHRASVPDSLVPGPGLRILDAGP